MSNESNVSTAAWDEETAANASRRSSLLRVNDVVEMDDERQRHPGCRILGVQKHAR
ncbi:MAG: hypothetical protein ACXVH3_27405 [Solirubrobacteraceae bacterium]